MSNQDRIGLLYDTAGELVAVRYSIFGAGSDGPSCIDAIEFSFVGGRIATVYAEPEFDTVRLELAEMIVREECDLTDATDSPLWTDLMGSRLSWIWILTNQQGYEDGLRLEFSLRRVVTLIAIASSIQVYMSDRIDLDLPS